MKFDSVPMICTHQSLMRMVRNSSELKQYHLEKERQEMLNCTSFNDTLHAAIENLQGAAIKAKTVDNSADSPQI